MGDKEDKWGVAGGVSASLCLFISDFLDTQLPPETIIRVSVMAGERRPDAGDVTDIIQIQSEGRRVSAEPLIGQGDKRGPLIGQYSHK